MLVHTQQVKARTRWFCRRHIAPSRYPGNGLLTSELVCNTSYCLMSMPISSHAYSTIFPRVALSRLIAPSIRSTSPCRLASASLGKQKIMRHRIDELDFLKGIFILLMMAFHLVYVSDMYPYAKQVVYTFHMPCFLIMSGYLMNINKPWKDFLRTMLGYAIPYVVMESGYIVMAAALPIREHLDGLTLRVFIEKLTVNPLGPYWYLQTLLIGGITYMAVFRLVPMKANSRIILLGLIFHVVSNVFGIMSFACSLYFLAGVALRQSGLSFTAVFQRSPIAIVAFALLAMHPQNLLMEQSGGVLMVYLVVVGCLSTYSHIGEKTQQLLRFLGRNTMPLFLFSPIFTFLCKPLVAIFLFDTTGLVYLLVSLTICVAGSLSVEWAMHRMGLAQYFYFKPL